MSKYLVRMADEHVARLAARNVAENEYWHGTMDGRAWDRAKVLARSRGAEKFSASVSGVCTTMFYKTPVAHRWKVVEIYCRLREESIYTHAIDHGNPDLVEEIKRVKYIVKRYTKHSRLDVINYASGHTKKYVLVLLFVILAAAIMGGGTGV